MGRAARLVLAAHAASAIAVDAAGSLYVADLSQDGVRQIEKRDPQGNWLVLGALLTPGASALAADAAGSLYVADSAGIQQRDAQGSWSVLAVPGTGPGQVSDPAGLAVGIDGHLYVVETSSRRVQEYTPDP